MKQKSALESYRALLAKLQVARKRAGGSLSQEVESEYISKLDQHWMAMSLAEKNLVDSQLILEALKNNALQGRDRL